MPGEGGVGWPGGLPVLRSLGIADPRLLREAPAAGSKALDPHAEAVDTGVADQHLGIVVRHQDAEAQLASFAIVVWRECRGGMTGAVRMRWKSKRSSRPHGVGEPHSAARPATLLLMAGLPALVALGVFANTVTGAFVYDDLWKINHLSGPAPSLWQLLLRSRGLTHAVHWMDKGLWGAWAPGFHLTNVVLHSLASALVAFAALALTRSRRVALLCGLIFAVHPVHVEAVASFVNRKEILAMIFAALALIIWRGRDRQVLRYLSALVCFALAILSKEAAALGLVGPLFAADLLPLPGNSGSWRRRLRRATWRALPFLLGGILFIGHAVGNLTRAFTPEAIQKTSQMQLRGYDQVLANVAGSVPDNLRLLFLPVKLCADYPPAPELKLTSPEALWGLTLVCFWMLAIFLFRRAPCFSFAMAWTFMMYVPCANLIPVIHFFVAERYLYVPSFGVCLLLALALDGALSRAEAKGRTASRAVVSGCVVLLITAGAARSIVRNHDWHSDRALWGSALQAGYDTWRIHLGLGTCLVREGRHEEAVHHFRRALHVGPLPLEARRSLVADLWSSGGSEEVADECRRILREYPGEWECHLFLGEISVREDDPARAVPHYQEAMTAQPNNPDILKRLAGLFATHPGAELCDLPQALEWAERARELTGGADPEVLHDLALLHAEAGNTKTAMQWAHQAFALALSQRRPELARAIRPTLRRLAYLDYQRRRSPSTDRQPAGEPEEADR